MHMICSLPMRNPFAGFPRVFYGDAFSYFFPGDDGRPRPSLLKNSKITAPAIDPGQHQLDNREYAQRKNLTAQLVRGTWYSLLLNSWCWLYNTHVQYIHT